MYTNFLTELKNAQMAKKPALKIPFSKMDMAIAELLVRMHYVESVAEKGRMPKRIIEVKLKYTDGKGVIQGIKFLSRPSLRQYTGFRDMKLVKSGYGMAVFSTPEGIMTGREARKKKIGGQALFEIW